MSLRYAPVNAGAFPFRPAVLEFNGTPKVSKFDLCKFLRIASSGKDFEDVACALAAEFGPLGINSVRLDKQWIRRDQFDMEAWGRWFEGATKFDGFCYETLGDWEEQIADLFMAVNLVGLMGKEHESALLDLFELSGSDFVVHLPYERSAVNLVLRAGQGKDFRSRRLSRGKFLSIPGTDGSDDVTPKNARAFVRAYLAEMITDGLWKHTKTVPCFSKSKKVPPYEVKPLTLTAVLWMSLHKFIRGELAIRTCEICGEKFSVVGVQRRRRKKCYNEDCARAYQHQYYKETTKVKRKAAKR